MKVIIFFFAGKRPLQLTSKAGIPDLKFFKNRENSTPVYFPFLTFWASPN